MDVEFIQNAAKSYVDGKYKIDIKREGILNMKVQNMSDLKAQKEKIEHRKERIVANFIGSMKYINPRIQE